MFVVDCYRHNFSNGVLFAYHIVVDVPGGSSNLGYRRRVPPGHNPTTRVKTGVWCGPVKLACTHTNTNTYTKKPTQTPVYNLD